MTATKKKPDTKHYHGHRQRLRERFLEQGAPSLADYELLELLLFGAIPRADTKPLAKKLLKQFSDLQGVLHATPVQLAEILPEGGAAIATIKLGEAMAERILQRSVLNKPLLSSWKQVLDYCRLKMSRLTHEEVRIIYLDTKNTLIGEERHQRGTVDQAATYPREVVKRALEHGATAIILVHNHPSGDPTPSKDDIETTRKIKKAADALGIALHDHLIIGGTEYVSFKNLGLV